MTTRIRFDATCAEQSPGAAFTIEAQDMAHARQIVDWLARKVPIFVANKLEADENHYCIGGGLKESTSLRILPQGIGAEDGPSGVICTFLPEVWNNGYGAPAEPAGPIQWFVPMDEVTELTGFTDVDDLDDDPDQRDDLRFARLAPQWVKDWSGPFEVEWEEAFDLTASECTDVDSQGPEIA